MLFRVTFSLSLDTKGVPTALQSEDEKELSRYCAGAMQNRLEHTIANLRLSHENLQAAESRIRDLDLADEIMTLTKNTILEQAATSMLAQANIAPQSILDLLH